MRLRGAPHCWSTPCTKYTPHTRPHLAGTATRGRALPGSVFQQPAAPGGKEAEQKKKKIKKKKTKKKKKKKKKKNKKKKKKKKKIYCMIQAVFRPEPGLSPMEYCFFWFYRGLQKHPRPCEICSRHENDTTGNSRVFFFKGGAFHSSKPHAKKIFAKPQYPGCPCPRVLNPAQNGTISAPGKQNRRAARAGTWGIKDFEIRRQINTSGRPLSRAFFNSSKKKKKALRKNSWQEKKGHRAGGP